MIRCEDWRNAPADTLQQLYRLERGRWMTRLHWDAEPSLRLLEEARVRGQAPGLLATDAAGRPLGWTYYVLHHRMLQIGGLVAASGEVTRALLDAVLHSPEADLASDLLCYAFPASPALESALARRRFSVTRYLYLTKTLAGHGGRAGSAAQPLRSGLRIAHWHERDAVATVRLMARAYAGVGHARCFAPRGTLDEWAIYVAQLIKMPACGQFLPSASLSATEAGPDGLDSVHSLRDLPRHQHQPGPQGPIGRPWPEAARDPHAPRGVLIATTLHPETAHIAQLVVDPTLRRRGLARDLIETASELAASAGCTRLTLLVAESNVPACSLYAAAGFEVTAHFLHATRQAPTRMRGVRPERTIARPAWPRAVA